MLLRTGLRVGEFTALHADAVVLIGAAHWLHVPVGKLHDDRYLPLHPYVVTLIDDYRTRHVAAGSPGRHHDQRVADRALAGRVRRHVDDRAVDHHGGRTAAVEVQRVA